MSKTQGSTCNCEACQKRYAYHRDYHARNESKVKAWHKSHIDRKRGQAELGKMILDGKTPSPEQLAKLKERLTAPSKR
jgi:hypothetical protein